MSATLLRFYIGVVLMVLLLFFSLNQLYNWVYQGDDMTVAARTMLHNVYQHSQAEHQLNCRLSINDDCAGSLYVVIPKDLWQPQPGVSYGIEVLRDGDGNASMCAEMSNGDLMCLSQLNLPQGADFTIDLVHVFLVLLLLALFWFSRNVFKDVETLRVSALQEIKQGRLPDFRLSTHSYLQPLARSLTRMNQTITNLNQLQREMADTVCHDIKTPLARLRFIMLGLERQMNDGQYAQVQRNLQEIEDNVYDYLRLAQQDFRADLELSQVRLSAVLPELLEKFRANTEHELTLHGDSDLTIQADAKLLCRALSNLLSNALRHCQHQVRIDLSLDGQDCRIDISDDGAGWHRDVQRDDLVPHHGIGLAIVRRVAHQHGGELLQLERPGGGAIARLQLPVGNADTGAATVATP
jgi:two-component system, OmpR family, sensor kinase